MICLDQHYLEQFGRKVHDFKEKSKIEIFTYFGTYIAAIEY